MANVKQIKVVSFNRSVILKNAYAIKAAQNVDFGTAQRIAWQEAKAAALVACLWLGAVEFTYVKDGGEVRQAVGTMKRELYDGETLNQTEVLSYGKTVRYFDCDVDILAARQCKIGRILKINRVCVYHSQDAAQALREQILFGVAA
jgi:hypothetical protein